MIFLTLQKTIMLGKTLWEMVLQMKGLYVTEIDNYVIII